MKDIKDLAADVGISSKGTKFDLVNRIKSVIRAGSSKFNKILRKFFGSSGGWVTFCCIHGIIYAVKFMLRAESPQDYIDILQSLKHKPNVFINDMEHIVASFGIRKFENPIFYPHDGQVADGTTGNIELAKDNCYQVSFPWLSAKGSNNRGHAENIHPVTGKDIYVALFDRFHETNTNKDIESLRRLVCVKELYAK